MDEKNQPKQKVLSKNLFPVVGIGASAGGLEAFKKLIKAIPENSGMAYILVQHLHPGHNSALPQILQRETNIPVQEISNNVKVEPDRVYVIPSNKMLVATDGILQLSPRPSKDHKNMPIDIFFSSLAEIHQSHAIGIVLSGNGIDGTKGLKNIKNGGGITFVQDLDSAANDSMPQSAIDAEVVDFILPPEKMPQQLLQLTRTLNIQPPNDPGNPEQVTEDHSLNCILAILRTRKSVDFTYYKQATIHRRILRRMVILKLEKISQYHEYLKQNKAEQDILFEDLLIPVTSFFRDPKTFDHLCKTVLADLTKNKSSINPLRIWVAGCSTGKEAYSLGICLHEYLGDKVSAIKIQIFATDISEKSIAKARTGLYSKSEVDGVSDARLQQFFTKTDGGFQITKSIRNICVFARHNFLKDPPFTKLDLVSCRNVLIYMDAFLQKKALNIFNYALNNRGVLFLGKSETVGSSSEYFLPLGKNEKLYMRKSSTAKHVNVFSAGNEEKFIEKDVELRANTKRKDDHEKIANDILLSKFSPASVIINDQLDVIQFRGPTAEFLELPQGKASLNVLKMAREGLSFELRNALHHAKTTNEPSIKEGIFIDDGKRSISIEVIPLPNMIEPHFMVLFKDTVINKLPVIANQQSSVIKIEDEKDIRIRQLEKNLLNATAEMSNIADDQEAANEELQSANEELLSGNEELQSLNEELETGKEELESTNEELITVNQELFDRNEQLDQARLYSEAIVTTIHEPLLVIGQDFKIISANKSFYNHFSITGEETIGKILFDLQKNQWDIPGLRLRLLQIQTKDEKFIEWEVTFKFPLAGERTICFNAQPIQKENGENWILLAFNDVTKRNEIEQLVFQNKEKEKRAAELIIANKELVLQNEEKEKRTAELIIANKELEQFSYIASHDLQEPLRTISNYMQVLEEDYLERLDHDALTYIRSVNNAAKRMSILVQALLNFSRLGRDKKLVHVDCKKVIADVITNAREMIKESKTIIDIGEMPEMNVYEKEFGQLFQNLISNGIKFQKKNTRPRIRIRAVEISEKWQFSVSDNGIGIAPSHFSRIFDIFQRLHPNTEYQGDGIGLANCKKIVELHQGEIWVESTLGKGTVFNFTIAHLSL